MQYVTFCIANDEDFEATLGIPAYDGDMEHGIDQINSYKAGMKEIVDRYPACKAVASVLRNLHFGRGWRMDGHLSERRHLL